MGERFVREGCFHEYVIQGNKAAVNPQQAGTKMARCIVRSWLRANR